MNQTMGISIEYTTNYSINEHQLYETNSMKQTILYETESMRLLFFSSHEQCHGAVCPHAGGECPQGCFWPSKKFT